MASLRLTKELENRLGHLAQVTGQTKTFYLHQLLEDRIYELKDRYIAKQCF